MAVLPSRLFQFKSTVSANPIYMLRATYYYLTLCARRLCGPGLFFLLLLALSTQSVRADRDIRLATTTSTENSGLLKYLLPMFESKCTCKVNVIAVGSGKALKLGENGDVDVMLVHSRADEDKFMEAGFGVNRRDVMYNDFVIVGPKADPARAQAATSAMEVLRRIADARATFVSRGDDSGTHKMELSLWKGASVRPEGSWYVSTGQGMGEVLLMASDRQAYALADHGTYLAFQEKTDLDILFAGDPKMFNPYGVIAVSPQHFPDVNFQGAMALINWLTSAEGQSAIAQFKVHGKQLFFPSAK